MIFPLIFAKLDKQKKPRPAGGDKPGRRGVVIVIGI